MICEFFGGSLHGTRRPAWGYYYLWPIPEGYDKYERVKELGSRNYYYAFVRRETHRNSHEAT